MIALSPADAKLVRGRRNEIGLEVTNRTGLDLEQPVVRLSLASLFTRPTEQAGLVVAAPAGWSAVYSQELAAWDLRAPEGFVLQRGATVEASIGQITPTVPVSDPLLRVVVGDQRATISVPVRDAAEPTEPELWDDLPALLSPTEIAISRPPETLEPTELRLTLRNSGDRALVDQAWGAWSPTLTLVLPTAHEPSEPGALTTPQRLDDVDVVLERGAAWRIVKRRPGPEWDLVAVPLGGSCRVLEAGESIELAIRGLITDFDEGPAVIKLRSHGFPDRRDSEKRFIVQKRAHRMGIVEGLRVSSPAVAGVAHLSWRVEHASLVQLSGVGEVPPAVEGFPVRVPHDTTVVLTAYDALLGAVLINEVHVEAGAPAPPSALPMGTILAWGEGEVPEGFAACDASETGVPDLSGRFIRGASLDQVAHEHPALHPPASATVKEAAHHHDVPAPWRATTVPAGDERAPHVPEDVREHASADERHDHGIAELDVAIEFGPAEPLAPRPPWRALRYIVKR
jgi:hypothetical protein